MPSSGDGDAKLGRKTVESSAYEFKRSPHVALPSGGRPAESKHRPREALACRCWPLEGPDPRSMSFGTPNSPVS